MMKFRNIIAGIIGVSFLFGTSAFANEINIREVVNSLQIKYDGLEDDIDKSKILIENPRMEIPLGLPNTDYEEQYNISLFSETSEIGDNINLLNGAYPWENLETYGNEVRVAVIDSGYAPHDELKANVLEGYSLLTNTNDVTDTYGHGTHVSGIIAAALNNTGVVGIAPKAKIVPIKLTNEKNFTLANVEKAIRLAVDEYDCDVINMSWGLSAALFYRNNTAAIDKLAENLAYENIKKDIIDELLATGDYTEEQINEKIDAIVQDWIEKKPDKYEVYFAESIDYVCEENLEISFSKVESALDYAASKGVLLVAAVGNEKSETICYPAHCESVIGVSSVGTATGEKEFSSEFSNYGASVFICAPGYNVNSTTLVNGYIEDSGTSFSTPHVAGLAAIAKSINPNITQDEFKQLLIDTSEDLGDEGYDVKYGYGLVNAQALVEKMIENTVYISPINTDEDGCSALIYNNTDKKATGISIWAEYGDALSVFNTPVSVEIEKGEKKTVEYDKLPGAKLKHFLWSDMNTLEPLGISRAYGE